MRHTDGSDKSLNSYIRIVEEFNSTGLAWSVLHGFSWLKTALLPAMKFTTKHLAISHMALLRAYDKLGDLYTAIDAPCAAVSAYRYVVKHSQQEVHVQHEQIADLLYGLGKEAAILQHHRKSATTNDGVHGSACDTAHSQHTAKSVRRAYSEDDESWRSSEDIIAGRLDKLAKRLRSKRSEDSRLARSRLFSVVGDLSRARREWKNLFSRKEVIELGAADWFFLSSQLWDSADFWIVLHKYSCRIKNLSLFNFDRNRNSVGPPMAPSDVDGRGRVDSYNCVIRLHWARCIGDEKELVTLRRQFPNWRDVGLVLRLLRKYGRSPTLSDLLQNA